MDIYALYSVLFLQPFSVQRKSVIFSAVLAGEPWSWQVIGISQAALEVLSKQDYQYEVRTICRAHIVDRIATAVAIFNIDQPLAHQQLFNLLVKNGRTIITTKSENKSARRISYLPIDSAHGLFKNKLISFTYGRKERNALRGLHSDFNNGRIALIHQDASSLPHKLALKQPAGENPVKPKADGKRVFEGTVGNTKYLFDAVNGDTVMKLTSASGIAVQAATINRTVVPRSEASKYAVNLLFVQWRTARKDLKKLGTSDA